MRTTDSASLLSEAMAFVVVARCPACGALGDPLEGRHPKAPPLDCLWCRERHLLVAEYKRLLYAEKKRPPGSGSASTAR